MSRSRSAFSEREFRLAWLGQLGEGISLQMLEVAIGWEVYAQHRNVLYLGLIGLAEFIPMFVLALPAGQLADRVPRRTVFAVALLLGAAVGVGLAIVSASGVRSVWPYLALAAGAGTTMALGSPAIRAMTPTLVPIELIQSAMTLRNVATQISNVGGPALGGLLYGISPTLVYLLEAGICLAAAGCVAMMRRRPAADVAGAVRDVAGPVGDVAGPVRDVAGPVRDVAGPVGDAARLAGEAAGAGSPPATLHSLLEGMRFVGRTKILLGAILLDLLAVLFGGAVALLPVFARSILHVGPTGLGVLRAAPAVGALIAAAVITRRPLGGRAGRTLFVVVGLFGASVIVFGLSRVFAISLLALAFGGGVDLYSMNIRATIVALATPDRLRGRVMAVEMVFISASNQLGAFESGLAAFLVGTVPAVVGGGVITILIALGWGRLFPDLARVDRLEEIKPPSEATQLAAAAAT